MTKNGKTWAEQWLPTLPEAERLHCLAEECAEVIQAIQQILRHGYDNWNPKNPIVHNSILLETELRHVMHILHMMEKAGDINMDKINVHKIHKETSIQPYLRFQDMSSEERTADKGD